MGGTSLQQSSAVSSSGNRACSSSDWLANLGSHQGYETAVLKPISEDTIQPRPVSCGKSIRLAKSYRSSKTENAVLPPPISENRTQNLNACFGSDFPHPHKWFPCRNREDHGLSECKSVTPVIIKETADLEQSNCYHYWERMVVILPTDSYEAWLQAKPQDSMDFIRQYPTHRLRAVAGCPGSSRRVTEGAPAHQHDQAKARPVYEVKLFKCVCHPTQPANSVQ